MPEILNLDIDALGDKILTDTKAILAGEWDAFTDEERDLVTRVSKDAAKLTLQSVAGQDVAIEKAHTDAQLANIASAVAGGVAGTIWKVVENVLGTVVGILKS